LFAGTFERKEKYIWVPFLDPGPFGTLVKEQGSLELILDYGAQTAHL
jgi:hypothetical protein